MPSETLTITDNRTGKTYELPITHETIKATDLRQMKTDPADFGLMPYDPSYMNTAACKSRISRAERTIVEVRPGPVTITGTLKGLVWDGQVGGSIETSFFNR